MRIAFVLTSLGVGGAERQVLALADLMSQRGHAVTLLVLLPRQSEEWPTAINLFRLEMRKRSVSLVAGFVNGCRFLRDFRPDLIHSHTFHANMEARLFRLLAVSAPVISTIHSVYEGGWGRMLAYRLTDALSQSTTAVSQAVALRYVRLRAVPARKCQVLLNGIDLAAFVPDPARRSLCREEMGAKGKFIWLAAGRIVPAKNYPNLLHAFSQVRYASPEAELWVAGEVVGGEFDRVGALAAEFGLVDCVRWLGLRRDLPALLDAADGFVLSSAWEGLPLAVGEAMAMEKPVVATDVGGVRELVGEAGLMVPPRRPAELAAAMIEVMQRSPVDCLAMGRSARAHPRQLQYGRQSRRVGGALPVHY